MGNSEFTPGFDGVWDDGEFIHWDKITDQVHEDDEADLLKEMLRIAQEYYEFTGRPLPIYGEIGELFAQRQYGFILNKPGSEGSDGSLLDDFYEVKTITPFKKRDFVRVKKSGNFNKLVLVKITEDHQISSKIFDRKYLPKSKSDLFEVSWDYKAQ